MYDIHVDHRHSVIEATLSGMMALDEVTAYIVDLKQAFVGNRLRSYAMVIDVSDCPIQRQDMV